MPISPNQNIPPEIKALLEEDKNKNGKPDFFEDSLLNILRKLFLIGKQDYEGAKNFQQKPIKAFSGGNFLRIMLLIGVISYAVYYFFVNR